ncbi:precorrin-6A synthase (deacetylating) [Lentzea sp. NBRC 105346]|uniref:precorrin-6A synthase (deacetylating) n=1 Tax=Lentzea sp. NBRC 105346 TaxID=3032205 RepID=UPI0024A44853|nr:precorrin-6A synthase (deacetylating) [Lentzea sp. NBRC 105346]GLZ30010.1 precorrin-6A synthase (deacetylating) [Lentzea sp. NBRC 105346]
MRKILVIGIGAGDPDHLTVQAVKALNTVDVFFVLDKGEVKQELVDLRQSILDAHVTRQYRVLEGRDPERDRTASDYVGAVDDWRRRRADVCAELVSSLGPDEVGAFLVWGDPSLYDSTLPILEDLLARGMAFEYSVIPGITSVAALTAAHRVNLNRTGRPVQITTGRRLASGWPSDVDDVAVMLDAHCAFADVDPDVVVYWGAYLGMPDETLISGRVGDVADRIVATRAALRAEKGWIMDTYLLRRS